MPKKVVVKGHTRKDGSKVKTYVKGGSGSMSKNAGKEYEANSFNTPNSSHITKVSHNPSTNSLYMTFKSGATYVYKGVDAKTYSEFKTAAKKGSAGEWHAKNIKGKFEYSKF